MGDKCIKIITSIMFILLISVWKMLVLLSCHSLCRWTTRSLTLPQLAVVTSKSVCKYVYRRWQDGGMAGWWDGKGGGVEDAVAKGWLRPPAMCLCRCPLQNSHTQQWSTMEIIDRLAFGARWLGAMMEKWWRRQWLWQWQWQPPASSSNEPAEAISAALRLRRSEG